jgi:hypothetical protein
VYFGQNNTTFPKRMFHDLYMFIIAATSSMFMTDTFIPYHSVRSTQPPLALQLFSAFVVHRRC